MESLMLTGREMFLLVICAVIYAVLFVVAMQSSRRKILLLRERLDKIHKIQAEQDAASQQSIETNMRRIGELEDLLRKMGDENSLLKLELEEKKARLDYTNKMAIIENEKRGQAETVIFGSEVYLRIKGYITEGKPMRASDWQQLTDVVNSVYTGFTEKLYSLYNLSNQDYYVSLLIKIRIQPRDIATLTAHSKESVASTRSRLYSRIFGKKGTTKDWDDFVLSL